MKILKLHKSIHNHHYVVFDEIPEITYEKVGWNFVGSAVDNEGNIIFSRYLKWENYGDAFAGRELTLNMKDGTETKIKDHWFDHGSYVEHGEFIDIGGGTLEELQDCYVYCSYNINKDTFEKMLDDYYSREREYEYREIEKWCRLQYKWYDVIVHGKKIPYMMNKKGDMVDKFTKERVWSRENVIKKIGDKWKEHTFFKFKYKDGNRLIRLEANYLEVLKNTLPFSTDDIIKNCKLPVNNEHSF